MKSFLYKYSFVLFIIFFIAALVAFWPGYYGQLQADMNPRNHTHGVGMSLWCVMLISQALLIRLKKHKIHKYIGWLSCILVPYILLSTGNLLHNLVSGARQLPNGAIIFITLVLLSLLAFAVTYGLAMINRKKPLIHARYMVATIFPMITPITDRLISRYFPELMEYAMIVNGRYNIQSLGFYLVDAIIVLLIIFDWLTPKRSYVFLFVLIINIAFQYGVFNLYKFDFWKSFSLWFAGLPLS